MRSPLLLAAPSGGLALVGQSLGLSLPIAAVSAHDPKAPYYDPSSKPSDPKWSVVHVKFRSKLSVPMTLRELRELGAAGKPLENMQMLKQSRLSVSRVSPDEWDFLQGIMAGNA